MKRTPANILMTLAVMLMACLGFQASAQAVEMAPASPAVFTADVPQAITSQDIFKEYVQPVHRRCHWRVRWKKHCCGGRDSYGVCYRWCRKKVRWCKKIWHKHRRYRQRRRRYTPPPTY